jgi:hypothetical protein
MEWSAIIDECIALIAPAAQHETECRRQIEIHDVLSWIRRAGTTPAARKADREALLRFADALADAAALLNETRCGHYLSLELHAFDAASTSKELETLVTAAREAAGNMDVKGGMPRNYKKLAAAYWAHQLIKHYGSKRPTLTDGGSYYQLASVLYGAATGEHGVDLSRQCKWMHAVPEDE